MGFIYENLFVDDLDALAALTNTSTPKRVDGVFLGVEDNTEGYPGWYRYYAASPAADDRPSVVAASDSIGAWFSFRGAVSNVPGQSAYTTTTASYTQPSVGSNVTVSVVNSEWMAIGQTIFISSGGTYTVASIPSSTSVSLTNLYTTNTAPSSTIATLRMVVSAGIKGDDGDPGLDGQSAYTTTTAGYTQPIVGDGVAVSVVNSEWMAVGQNVFISGGGSYEVESISSTTSISLINLYSSNTSPGSAVATSQSVVASGIKGDTGSTGSISSASSIILTNASTPTTASNETAIFVDSADEILKARKESNGVVDNVALLDSALWKYSLFYG